MGLSDITELTYFRGRVGLYAMLKALGVGEGDDVAFQAFTCLAMPEAVMATGARCRYVDIEPDGVNVDPAALARRITPNTRAIVVQHTYGIPARMDEVLAVARQADLPLIGDCCHTLLSTYAGRPVSEFGEGSFFSHEWGKPVIIGIGGSVRVNDERLLAELRRAYEGFVEPPASVSRKVRMQYLAFRMFYRPSVYWTIKRLFHWTSRLGLGRGNFNPIADGEQRSEEFSWRMSSHHRKLLGRKLQLAEAEGRHAREIAAIYDEGIRAAGAVRPVRPAQAECTLARYPLLVDNKDEMLARAQEAKVEVSGWYATPVHPVEREQWPLIHYEATSCPNAERNAGRIVSLPLGPKVDAKAARRIIDFLNGS